MFGGWLGELALHPAAHVLLAAARCVDAMLLTLGRPDFVRAAHPRHPHPCPPPAGNAVQAAVEELRPLGRQHDGSARGGAAVYGMGCNVARPAEVAAFADFAKEQLGTVDMWIKWVLGKTWVLAMACRESAEDYACWARLTCGSSGCS